MLTRPQISHFTEEELRAQDDAYLASLPKPKPAPAVVQPAAPEKPKQLKLSKEEELLRDKWNRLLEMVHKGRLEPLKAFLQREDAVIGGVNAKVPDWTGERAASILQVAVQSGHEEMVQWLLEEARADPTIPVPLQVKSADIENTNDAGNKSDASDGTPALPSGSRKMAYDLSRTKPIRDIFRRCAAAHPDWWDWFGAAHLPSALSLEMEEERDEKKKVRRKGLKDRVKEREAREKDKPVEPPIDLKPPLKNIPPSTSTSASRRLGGGSGAAEGVVGLTPEMRAKVERERRARAAEARMKALGGG